MAPSRLPPELILHVLEAVVPKKPGRRVAYSQKNIITKTLLAFTLVARLTSKAATRLLLQHCLYVDNSKRLASLLRGFDEDDLSTAQLADTTLPPLRSISSMFLAPFDNRTIDDQPTAIWVRTLCYSACSSLKSLIIDIPLRSLYPEADHLGVRKLLREAFIQLVNLEEFVSVQDELYLDVHHPEERIVEEVVWTLWPRLRRLALYNVDITPRGNFWDNVAKLQHLDTVILTRTDGVDECDIKAEYLQRSNRAIKILIANVASDHRRIQHGATDWEILDPDGKVTVLKYNIPISYYGDEDHITLGQEWIREGAIRRDMWEWTGDIVT